MRKEVGNLELDQLFLERFRSRVKEVGQARRRM